LFTLTHRISNSIFVLQLNIHCLPKFPAFVQKHYRPSAWLWATVHATDVEKKTFQKILKTLKNVKNVKKNLTFKNVE